MKVRSLAPAPRTRVGEYSTKEVAHMLGVHRDTLLRWIREKKIDEVPRRHNGYRVFTDDDIKRIRDFMDQRILPKENLS